MLAQLIFYTEKWFYEKKDFKKISFFLVFWTILEFLEGMQIWNIFNNNTCWCQFELAVRGGGHTFFAHFEFPD